MMLEPVQQEALEQIAAAAVQCERETSFPAEISAAQCILESAWLTRCPGNNCFGIKRADRHSQAQYSFTKEFEGGEWKTKKLAFAAYGSLAACFEDHARLLMGGFKLPKVPNCYYTTWVKFRGDHNIEAYVAAMGKKYATEPDYATKILKLMQNPGLDAAIKVAWRARGFTPTPNEEKT